jgi:hypothetical protein
VFKRELVNAQLLMRDFHRPETTLRGHAYDLRITLFPWYARNERPQHPHPYVLRLRVRPTLEQHMARVAGWVRAV